MNPLIKKFQYGNHTVTLETGRIARQATGAVLCSIDDTSVPVSYTHLTLPTNREV